MIVSFKRILLQITEDKRQEFIPALNLKKKKKKKKRKDRKKERKEKKN